MVPSFHLALSYSFWAKLISISQFFLNVNVNLLCLPLFINGCKTYLICTENGICDVSSCNIDVWVDI